MTTSNLKRKQKSVKNAYTDVDSVAIQPGTDYKEWIKITKDKLYERECKIRKTQIIEVEGIINGLNNSVFIFPKNIRDDALGVIRTMISRWKGVNIGRTKKSMTQYRNYFNVAKNWWDQSKKRMIGDIFWVPLFEFIQNQVGFSLVLTVWMALFRGSVKYPNTKSQRLIIAGAIIHSSQLYAFLLRVDETTSKVENVGGLEEQQSVKDNVKNILIRISKNESVSATICDLDNLEKSNNINSFLGLGNNAFEVQQPLIPQSLNSVNINGDAGSGGVGGGYNGYHSSNYYQRLDGFCNITNIAPVAYSTLSLNAFSSSSSDDLLPSNVLYGNSQYFAPPNVNHYNGIGSQSICSNNQCPFCINNSNRAINQQQQQQTNSFYSSAADTIGSNDYFMNYQQTPTQMDQTYASSQWRYDQQCKWAGRGR